MPESAGGLAYAGGFMAATALLHIAGIGIGFAIGKIGQRVGSSVVRLIGGLAALVGVGILTGTL
jgi:urease accessory protein